MKILLLHRLILTGLAAFLLTTASSEAARVVAARGVGVRGVGVVAVQPVVRAPVARTVATVATVNAVSKATVAATVPAYIPALPAGNRAAAYGGYNCFVAGGVYYRPIIYNGKTVYVIVP
jgi:hypothetical protein